MKKNLIENTSLLLLKNNFTIKNIKTPFDLLAKKDSKVLLIKILEDANSISIETINEMKKLAKVIQASPLILSQKAGFKLQNEVVYQRYGINTINFNTFNNSFSKSLFINSNKSGFAIKIIGKKLKEKREQKDFSLSNLASKLSISSRMISKYEAEDSNISLNKAIKLEKILGSDIFQQINLLTSDLTDIFYDSFSDVSKKYHSLGFTSTEFNKLPINVIARKKNEIILTKTTDKPSKEFFDFADLFELNNLIIFKKKKPKTETPVIHKEEFLDLDDGNDLISFMREFE
ncbi:hypothetical protein CL618_02435 [archaeon]|nr:hypothetical protein [archaeon]|tara:strand:+ start:3496 stop:4362 length:867 start_codon:yes stop_codon:yes gene_type:complete